MKHIETWVFVLMVFSWGLLGGGLALAVLKWVLTKEGASWSAAWRRHRASIRQVVRGLGSTIGKLAAQACRAYRKRYARPSIQFLVADDEARRDLEPCLRAGLARLAHATAMSLPPETAVLVQRTIGRDGQTPGLNQTLPLPGACQRVLLRLALEVDGQARTGDQLLSTLVEQYIALVAPGTEVHARTAVERGHESRSVQAPNADRHADVDGTVGLSATRPQLVVLALSQQDSSSAVPASQDTATSHSPTAPPAGDPLVAPAQQAERAG